MAMGWPLISVMVSVVPASGSESLASTSSVIGVSSGVVPASSLTAGESLTGVIAMFSVDVTPVLVV